MGLLEWLRGRFEPTALEDAEWDCGGASLWLRLRLWEKLVAEEQEDAKAADGDEEDEKQDEGVSTGAGAAGTMAHALELMGVAVAATEAVAVGHAFDALVVVAFGATCGLGVGVGVGVPSFASEHTEETEATGGELRVRGAVVGVGMALQPVAGAGEGVGEAAGGAVAKCSWNRLRYSGGSSMLISGTCAA